MNIKDIISIILLMPAVSCSGHPEKQRNLSEAPDNLVGCYEKDGFEDILITKEAVHYGDVSTFKIATYGQLGRSRVNLLYVIPDMVLREQADGRYKFKYRERPRTYKRNASSLMAEVPPEHEGTSIDFIVDSHVERFAKIDIRDCDVRLT